LIYAHEFSWNRERDPVWKRLERLWGMYGRGDRLAFALGFGTIQANDPPASHCNNIGAVHRKLIHEAFGKWFNIQVKLEDEYSNRRMPEELTCLTAEARQRFEPQPLHVLLSRSVNLANRLPHEQPLDAVLARSAAVREESLKRARRQQFVTREMRGLNVRARNTWASLLGKPELMERDPFYNSDRSLLFGKEAGSGPLTPRFAVREGSPATEIAGPLRIERKLLDIEPGITVPLLLLKSNDADAKVRRPIALGVAMGGSRAILAERRDDLARLLARGVIVALPDVRGTGATSAGQDHGQQSAATAHAATCLMLSKPLLGAQLSDLRAVWRYLKDHDDVDPQVSAVFGHSSVEPLSVDAKFSYPRRIDERPVECQPGGPLLALLLGLYEREISTIETRGGLLSYASILDTPFVQVPAECILPGAAISEDLSRLVAVLAPRRVTLEGLVDGCGRAVPASDAQKAYDVAMRYFAEAGIADRLEIRGHDPRQPLLKDFARADSN
jgi:hypothetical protein